MRELSLHILDIAHNSIAAKAETLRIAIIEDFKKDLLTIRIKDDGKGMDEATLKRVVDPFYTTRTTRKVGLGIPMFKAAAEQCGGEFEIKSQLGVGTEIDATFKHSHIDRVPLGNMTETIITIIMANTEMDLIYTHDINGRKFTLSTRDIKKTLGELPINNMDVVIWLKGYIHENLVELAHGQGLEVGSR
jgi:hypothetical protein